MTIFFPMSKEKVVKP